MGIGCISSVGERHKLAKLLPIIEIISSRGKLPILFLPFWRAIEYIQWGEISIRTLENFYFNVYKYI